MSNVSSHVLYNLMQIHHILPVAPQQYSSQVTAGGGEVGEGHTHLHFIGRPGIGIGRWIMVWMGRQKMVEMGRVRERTGYLENGGDG